MNAARGERDYHITGGHGLVVDDLILVNYASAVAREVVLVYRIEAGHLGGLAADERRAGLHAALADAADDIGYPLGIVLAAGDVIEEEQGLCAAANYVVDAHCHAVYADGVVLVHEKGQLEFCTHSVCAADEHGLCYARQV